MVDTHREAAIYSSMVQPNMAFRDADGKVGKIRETRIGIESA